MLRISNTRATPFATIGATAQPIPAPRDPPSPPPAQRQDSPEELDQRPSQQAALEPAPEAEAKPAESNRGIELIIDSLTSHTLIEPILVSITPLGDELFTASARDLGIQATGNDIGEALISLKQQIEEIYDSLNKRSRLDAEEKVKLQTLRTYIAPPERKRWL